MKDALRTIVSIVLLLLLLGAATAPEDNVGDRVIRGAHLLHKIDVEIASAPVPSISGSKVVFETRNFFENRVYLYDGSTAQELAAIGYTDGSPRISGSNVVWTGIDFEEGEDDTVAGNEDIFVYNGTTEQVTNLSMNNGVSDWGARISGSNVIWVSEGDGGGEDLYFDDIDDGDAARILTALGSMDATPELSGSNVAWVEGSEFEEIYYYSGAHDEITLLSSLGYVTWPIAISGQNVAWTSMESEVMFFDGANFDGENPEPEVIAQGFESGFEVQISGANIAWSDWPPPYDGFDDQIFFYDGEEVHQLTDNSGHHRELDISGSNIVWRGRESNSDTEIYFFDGTETIQVTDNEVDDDSPKISGRNFTWIHEGPTGAEWVYVAYWLGPGAVLEGVDLEHADLEGRDLSGSDLRRAAFADANIGSTDFSGADLSEATGLGATHGDPRPFYDDATIFTNFDPEENEWTYVPEPSAALSTAAALFALGGLRRRRLGAAVGSR